MQNKVGYSAAMAQNYLESQLASMTNDYTLAITSYALKLANSRMFSTAFAKLNSHAIIKGNMFIFIITVTKTCLFKYIENFTTIKMNIFR